ncbi:hypothetical protein L7F22_037043 [Adiantum nelumboides]|nr:hypothetical protein [Adiantum nelumboides]MCO5583135.1 hypothetical protein [Adiantum nelumboides]
MAALASAPGSCSCLSLEDASDAQAFFVHTHFRRASQPRQKYGILCFARNLPPEKGSGRNARKASYQGLQRIMKGKEADMEGWTEIVKNSLRYVTIDSVDVGQFHIVLTTWNKGLPHLHFPLQVASAADLLEGKNKAIIHDRKGYVLVKRAEGLHAIEANCTSCKFPIIEGKTSQQEDGALEISCPLCHTSFSLEDGRVLQHCPKDGPVQWLIGTMKEKTPPVAAKILPARISKSGRVYVRFLNMQVI